MVHTRVIVYRREQPASSAGEQAAASCCKENTSNGSKRWRWRRGDAAIVAIKEQLLRCSSTGEQGRRRRFKRGYLLAGDGRGDAADSAIFYLACVVCTSGLHRAAPSLPIGVEVVADSSSSMRPE
nr:unnamed protein product [Digitaria exilis]